MNHTPLPRNCFSIWRRRYADQRGVTLIEVLITMALLSVFLVMFATLFTASIDVQFRSQTYSSVSSDGRFLLARLNYDITRASAVTTPAALGGSSNSLVLTISGGTYTYNVNSGRLQLASPAGTDYLTGNGDTISSVSFVKLGNSGGLESIQYTFTLTGKGSNAGNTNTQTFSSTTERRS